MLQSNYYSRLELNLLKLNSCKSIRACLLNVTLLVNFGKQMDYYTRAMTRGDKVSAGHSEFRQLKFEYQKFLAMISVI